jgi:DNA polymerase III alpha subunit
VDELKINPYGQVTISQDEAVEALYSKRITDLKNVYIDLESVVNQYNQARMLNADRIPALAVMPESQGTVEQFDRENQKRWFMPEEYNTCNIVDWLYAQCQTAEQKNRVTEELELFAQYDMMVVLKYMKYLVDTMRKNNIVWGVGRGSSVASYVLYLIGIHRIDSLKYQLEINEFLK